jgi:hypothetical protein
MPLTDVRPRVPVAARQGQLKLEAAAALVEEQLKRRETLEAEQAAGDARAAEQEAQVGAPCCAD